MGKSDKRAILVLGPESSGTRLMTRILIDAGCAGSDDHVQPFDARLPDRQDLIVWRRSFPHNRKWPNVIELVDRLEKHGFSKVRAVVTMRDWYAMCCSQVAAGHVESIHEALMNIQWAYGEIFGGLRYVNVPYVVCHYESLVQRSWPVVSYIMDFLGLELPSKLYVYDANEKWFDEPFPKFGLER